MRSIKWQCFRCPWVTPNPQTTPIFGFFVAFHIFIVLHVDHVKNSLGIMLVNPLKILKHMIKSAFKRLNSSDSKPTMDKRLHFLPC